MQPQLKPAMNTPDSEASKDESTEKLRSILKHLNMKSTDIEASAIISSDGLIKTSILGDAIDPDRFGAMCATLLALAKRAATETSRGDLRQVLIEGSDGTMLIVQIGNKGVLALSATSKANLGMLFLEAKRTSEKISEII